MIRLKWDECGDIHMVTPDPTVLVKHWKTYCGANVMIVAAHTTNLHDVTCASCMSEALVGDLIRAEAK